METDLNNMTMRDLFAAFAMGGMLASEINIAATNGKKLVYTKMMYEWADAMIEARRQDNDTGL